MRASTPRCCVRKIVVKVLVLARMDPRAENDPSFYLYVLECADGTWYTGYTVDVAERVRAHNAGAGASTRAAAFPCACSRRRLTRRSTRP